MKIMSPCGGKKMTVSKKKNKKSNSKARKSSKK